MSAITHLRATSSSRPPDWRWEKAKLLYRDKRKPSRRWDDERIAKALQFLQDIEGLDDEWDQFEVLERWPALHDAWMIRQDNSTCRRWELEAWLMVKDITYAKISKWCGIPVPVISWYESLFFNVRDRLNDIGWVCNVVLGRPYHTSMNDIDFELIWKAFAWRGGAAVLEDVMTKLAEDTSASGTAVGWYRQQHRAIAGRNAVTAGLTMRSRDPYVKGEILELQRKYIEMDQQTGGSSAGGDDAMLAGVNALLSCFNLSVVSSSDEASKSLIDKGVELRTPLLMSKSLSGSFEFDSDGAEFPVLEEPKEIAHDASVE